MHMCLHLLLAIKTKIVNKDETEPIETEMTEERLPLETYNKHN